VLGARNASPSSDLSRARNGSLKAVQLVTHAILKYPKEIGLRSLPKPAYFSALFVRLHDVEEPILVLSTLVLGRAVLAVSAPALASRGRNEAYRTSNTCFSNNATCLLAHSSTL
jgi:hypothetical protein